MIRVQQKALVLFLWRTRAAYALYACRGTTTIYPVQGPQSVRSLLEGLDRRTITGASRSRLLHLNKWWFTGWLEGVIEKGRRQYFQQLYCSLKTPGSLSTCPCRCLVWCSCCDYSMAWL